MPIDTVNVIIFDVDGTLVDSKDDIVKAMNYALREVGAEEREPERIVSYIGTGARDLVKKSLGKRHGKLFDKAVKIFSEYYVKHSADKSKLYPHVKEVLGHFKYKRKFILTNRYRRFADVTLKELGIRGYFEDIIGGDDESCLKPSACVLDRALPKMKIDKKEALIVGDMAIDVNTGKNSGVKTCWVTYGLGKKEDVEPLRPDYIIDDIIELKDIIN